MDFITLSERKKYRDIYSKSRMMCLSTMRKMKYSPDSNRGGGYLGRRDKYSYTHRINAPNSTDLHILHSKSQNRFR